MDINFARLNQLAFGYWHAQTLFALTDLGVFDTLYGGGKTASAITKSCALDANAGESLLNAGVALGLLRKQGSDYENTDMANRLLISEQPGSLVNWVRVMGRWSAPWTKMDQAIKAGHAIEPQSQHIAEDPDYLEAFILGMHEYASRTSADVAAAVDLTQAERLVDVGGGAGTYSIALCQRYPQLSSVVLDLAPVLAITRRTAKSAGLEERIRTEICDYRQSAFGNGNDAVLLSNVLHQESRAVGLDMLGRALAALKPTGMVIVHGHFLDDERTSPVFATLHNLSARTIWEGGHSYTANEMTALLSEAGFSDVAIVPVAAGATKLVVGYRSA